MSKKIRMSIAVSIAILIIGVVIMSLSFKAFSTYSVEITGIPNDVVSGQIEYLDEQWNASSTKASVSIKSPNATVSGMTENGYYTVTFCTKTKEVGKAEFFLGNSGKVYSYTYELKGNEYSPVYTGVTTIKYEDYGYGRILDITGDAKVPVNNIPDTSVSADISVSVENGDYGYLNQKVAVKDEIVQFNLGIAGYYSITFFNADNNAIGTAEFTLDKNKEIFINDYIYDEATGEWEEKLTKTDVVYFSSYDDYDDFGSAEDEVTLYSVTVQDVPSSVSSIETQYLDISMNQADCYADTKIVGDGTVSVTGLNNGYYTFNFYDSSYNCIGYTAFYLDENGDTYSYDKASKLDKLKYSSVEQKKSYTYGNMKVSVYGIPEEIDSVETYYFYGNESDQSILFEPEFSSLSNEPLIISKLGMEGKYNLNFYTDGKIVGNAEFYLDKSGVIYDIDYQYNSKTGEWEEKLSQTTEVYYYENTDIEDADDYGYGNVKFTITNVPVNVKYSEVTYFENDDTFTAGSLIFPDVTINGKGTVSINNLGEEGYYEIDLISGDSKTKLGYVFIYIDSNKEVYFIEQNINPDTFQIETTKTKTVQIPLKEYLSSTVEYIAGKQSVSVYDVPNTINKMLLTVITPDGNYATYEDKISVDSNGKAVIGNLGMEGDYTVSFFTDKDYIGSATFYLSKDGKLYKADYSYDENNNISISLTALNKVIFEKNKEAMSYEVGDVDFNGSINIADVILLQKYLLKIQPFSASQWFNADLNSDNTVNVFDMCLLKRILINKNTK